MENIYEEIEKINEIRFNQLMVDKEKLLKKLSKRISPLKTFSYHLIDTTENQNKEYHFVYTFKKEITKKDFTKLFKDSIRLLDWFNNYFMFAPYKIMQTENIYEVKIMVGYSDSLFFKRGYDNIFLEKENPS